MKIKYRLIALVCLLMIACSEDYLDAKSNKSLTVPTTVADFQALLDNVDYIMNAVPAVGVIASDDSYMNDNDLLALYTSTERNSYSWEEDVYQGEQVDDWDKSYLQVFYANVALDGLADVERNSSNKNAYDNCRGMAFFTRAFAHYHIAEIFALPYDENAASTIGIPVRTTSDVFVKPVRVSQEETYDQIIEDLLAAAELLTESTNYKTRPSKAVAYAMLSKVYLSMRDFGNAELYADKALAITNYLMDYNELDPFASNPIPSMNDEIMYYASVFPKGYFYSPAYMDSTLMNEYDDNDLRKIILFREDAQGRFTFRGYSTLTWAPFGGIAVDEMFLTRAECRVRNGDVSGALNDLNTLLIKRYKEGAFSPVTEASADLLLDIILLERRKELIFRNNRWSDLRRLNRDPATAKTLDKKVNGIMHVLPPDDLRYAFPIPDSEIMTSGIEQNPR